MASFDFIDASAKGYKLVWQDRSYLFRAALPVFLVKLACLLAVFALGAQNNYLRQGLILMPGQVVEAIFAIGLIRYTLYREPIFIWSPTKNAHDTDINKKKAIQGGIAMYLLLKVVGNAISAWLLDNAALAEKSTTTDTTALPPLISAIIIFTTLMLSIWAFRLLWLYIPITMGYSISSFMKKSAGIQSSIYMIATWLICFLPLLFVFAASLGVFSDIFANQSTIQIIVKSIVESMAEIIMIAIQIVAMTYGIKQIFVNNKNQP